MSEQTDYKQLRGTPVIQILSTGPSTPPAEGYLFLYPKDDNRFYQMDSEGVEKPVDDTAIQYFFESRRLIGLLIRELKNMDIEVINDELIELTNNI